MRYLHQTEEGCEGVRGDIHTKQSSGEISHTGQEEDMEEFLVRYPHETREDMEEFLVRYPHETREDMEEFR